MLSHPLEPKRLAKTALEVLQALSRVQTGGAKLGPKEFSAQFELLFEQALTQQLPDAAQTERAEACEQQELERVAAALSEDATRLSDIARDLGQNLEAGVPLLDGASEELNEALGTVGSVVAGALRATQEAQKLIVSTRASMSAYETQIAELRENLVSMASLVRSDSLTGAVNRRGMDWAISTAEVMAESHEGVLTVVVVDLDHFRNVNNTHGHAAGDTLLKWFAQCVKASLRAGDQFIRVGGEEFVLLLPGATAQGAAYVIQRIQAKYRKPVSVASAALVSPTFSAGVSQKAAGLTTLQVIDLADGALLKAKAQGRDRFVIAS
jgi:diguanylate cyclase (GGDEF)-like protein